MSQVEPVDLASHRKNLPRRELLSYQTSTETTIHIGEKYVNKEKGQKNM
jgi:hypothetical protein